MSRICSRWCSPGLALLLDQAVIGRWAGIDRVVIAWQTGNPGSPLVTGQIDRAVACQGAQPDDRPRTAAIVAFRAVPQLDVTFLQGIFCGFPAAGDAQAHRTQLAAKVHLNAPQRGNVV
jgi:hypothetical protein